MKNHFVNQDKWASRSSHISYMVSWIDFFEHPPCILGRKEMTFTKNIEEEAILCAWLKSNCAAFESQVRFVPEAHGFKSSSLSMS